MHIRPLQPSDVPALVDLTIEVFGPFFEQTFRHMVPPDIYAHQHGHWADDYRDTVPQLHDPDHGKHVAVVDSEDHRVAGFTGWHLDQERRHGQIEFLAVRKSARRGGVGRALCEHAIEMMREHDVEVVSLGTGGDPFHAPARALYESLGFYPVPVVYYLRTP